MIWLEYKNTKNKSEWIFAFKLTHITDLVFDFHITYPAKPSPLLLSWSHCSILYLHVFFNRVFLYLIL